MLTRIPHPRLVLAILGVAVLAAAALAGSAVVSSPSTSLTQTTPRATTTTPAGQTAPPADPAGTARYTNYRVGFSIAYPKDWTRLRSKDPSVNLIAAKSRATSMLVRSQPVGLDVTRDTLPIVRSLTDSLVRADKRVQVLGAPQAIVIDGLPGYRYVYTFTTASGTRGAHVHYFLFKRKRMITLVFQTVPATRLEQVSTLFEGLAATLRGSVG